MAMKGNEEGRIFRDMKAIRKQYMDSAKVTREEMVRQVERLVLTGPADDMLGKMLQHECFEPEELATIAECQAMMRDIFCKAWGALGYDCL